jgi:DNA-binding NtrC family response regulator
VLLIDDESGIRNAISRILRPLGIQIKEASNGKEALHLLQEEGPFDVIILDLMMPVMNGVEFLQQASNLLANTTVLVCSANADISVAVNAMKFGASDYIEKPIEPEILRNRIKLALENRRLHQKNNQLRQEVKDRNEIRILGNSKAMRSMQLMIERLAQNTSTVLITGESGTGKELIARALHYSGSRSAEPFNVVDCAAVSPTIIEAELFGHEKGAYTGAHTKRQGLLVSAGKGTVFFDEIGELPLELQAKLLRVLQERQVRAIGSSEYQPVEARIITATNRNLKAEVEAGRFRDDLYYRLFIVSLVAPPLRKRKDDIPLLSEFFLNKYKSEYGEKIIPHPDLEKMLEYSWPGNVRELENSIHRAMAITQEGVIKWEDILKGVESSALKPASPVLENDEIVDLSSVQTLQEAEKAAIIRALKYSEGNRRVAASALCVGEATLYRKIKDYDINL